MTLSSLLGAALVFMTPRAPAQEPRWPLLPSIARVNVEVARDHLVVIEDVTLPRGDYVAGDLSMLVAFGATMPLALDARIFPVADGRLEPDAKDRGEPISVEQNRHAERTLLGQKEMAGVTVTLTEASFKKALAPGNMALLRVRQIVRVPAADAAGNRELVVRLGKANGNALTLARVEVKRGEGAPEVSDVGAHLCGKEADAHPLYVLTENASALAVTNAVAPVLSTRHPSDDLCVQFRSM